jgi:flagellar export protein FliJ
MTRDPLEALLRLRRMAVDQVRRDLAECLRLESAAMTAVAAIKAAIARETEVASSLAAGDAEVEAFGAWLRRIRPMQLAALAAESAAETATVASRTLLGAARAAVRAAEQMVEKRAVVTNAATERRAQGEIDEAALQSYEAALETSTDNASSADRPVSGAGEGGWPSLAAGRGN